MELIFRYHCNHRKLEKVTKHIEHLCFEQIGEKIDLHDNAIVSESEGL